MAILVIVRTACHTIMILASPADRLAVPDDARSFAYCCVLLVRLTRSHIGVILRRCSGIKRQRAAVPPPPPLLQAPSTATASTLAVAAPIPQQPTARSGAPDEPPTAETDSVGAAIATAQALAAAAGEVLRHGVRRYGDAATDADDVGSATTLSELASVAKSAGSAGAAERMMAAMGWAPGRGLGREEQGIPVPLRVKFSAGSGARIVAPKQSARTVAAPETAAPTQLSSVAEPAPAAAALGSRAAATSTAVALEVARQKALAAVAASLRPSRVLLLENMVTPGQVDADLTTEVADECRSQYGPVVGCRVSEVRGCVRVFVEFAASEAAQRAKAALHGRYFGQRLVQASYYSEERYARHDYGP